MFINKYCSQFGKILVFIGAVKFEGQYYFCSGREWHWGEGNFSTYQSIYASDCRLGVDLCLKVFYFQRNWLEDTNLMNASMLGHSLDLLLNR